MLNIELLKKLTFIADITKKLEPFLFDDIGISINPSLENSDDVSYAFQVLKIPFKIYKPETPNVPDVIVATFGCEIGLNVIYLITYVLKEIYNDKLDIYILYATKPEGLKKKIAIGNSINRDQPFTNISAPIQAIQILKLEINNIDWEAFIRIFPNNNYSDCGTCAYTPGYYHSDDYYDYNELNYSNYGGAYGYDDDTINSAFEGDPENYWNID